MIALYRLLFLPVFLLFSPFYLIHILKRGGYAEDFSQRLGNFPKLPAKTPQRRRLWLHVVSVGEAQSVKPLVAKIVEQGKFELVITTTTSTGYRVVRDLYGKVAYTGLFPLDFWWCSRRTWKRIQPDLVALTDSELWPEHLHQAKIRHVPVVLINARLSDRSYRRYRHMKFLAKRLWNSISRILASSAETQERLVSLGVDSSRIFLTGNIKCDRPDIPELSSTERHNLLVDLGLRAEGDRRKKFPKILFGCSTWKGEEAFLLKIFENLSAKDTNWRLILTPRHAERRHEIQSLLESKNYRYTLRSLGKASQSDAQVAIVDTTGELASLIRLGTVAFVGKSLAPNVGGQSPLDGIAAGVPLVMGPNMNNFRQIVEELRALNAVVVGKNKKDLQERLLTLAKDDFAQKKMATLARHWLARNRGAVDRVYHALEVMNKRV